MKIVFSALGVLLISSIVHAYQGFGICNYGNETVTSVICYGPTVLDTTTVKEYIKVAGPLSARKSVTGELTITGNAFIQDSTIKGAVNIAGNVTAYGVRFENNIIIFADKTILSHSLLMGSLTINTKSTKPYLIVQCGTEIGGSVVFNGNKGWVQISNDSIIHGQIINATIEFVKRKCY